MKTAAIWTLWLITYGGNGGMPTVTPLSTYDSESLCIYSITAIQGDLDKLYGGKQSSPSPGVMFCVQGTPPKR